MTLSKNFVTGNSKLLIIAEAGVNHNGDPEVALELVDAAAAAGADMVKFQTFDARRLASAGAPKAAYQTRSTDPAESQFDMLSRLQLSLEAHHELKARCDKRGIAFLSSPFDIESLHFLTDAVGLDTIKLGSGELTNAPLLLAAARTEANLIISSGMATLSEIEEALGVVAFGLVNSHDAEPSRDAFLAGLLDRDARSALRERVMLLHCTTEYPAAVEDSNLRAIDTIRAAFGIEVGYSDHTEGDAVAIAAVARGARVIEKHFTLDRSLPGPDHAASIEPEDLSLLVRNIRKVEQALGDGLKFPSPAEIANRSAARKSLCAARDLPSGRVLTLDDITVKRPGTGLPPIKLWETVGRELKVPLAADDPITEGSLR